MAADQPLTLGSLLAAEVIMPEINASQGRTRCASYRLRRKSS
jgi:hypothetical protein